MENKINIIEMSKCHIKEIAELEKVCFSLPWSEISLEAELHKENSCFLVALVSNKFAGYVGMNFVLDEGYITNVAVQECFRNQGVAKQLITSLFTKCEKEGLSFLSLEVRVSNNAAVSLYESLDFKQVGIRKNFYDNPKEDAFIMTKYFG